MAAASKWNPKKAAWAPPSPCGSLPASPGSPDAPVPAAPTTTSPVRPSEKSLRILVADDEETVREFLQFLLTEEGYIVDIAHDGTAALKLLGTKQYGVLLMDHAMPGLSGVETFRTIHRQFPKLPVILVTGSVSIDPDGLLREGFFRVLSKPLPAAREILKSVAEALRA